MKYLFSILFFFLVFQSTNYKLINKLEKTGDYFFTDNLQNIYLIQNNQLIKYDIQGNQTAIYSNNYLGQIFSVDVSNPLRILLFYKDYNQIVFLDKNFIEIFSPIILDDLDEQNTEIVCSSYLGGFWIYDNQTSSLKYYNKNLQIEQQSQNLNQIKNIVSKANILIEKSNYVYINFPDIGILMFDKFGAYIKTIHIKGIKSLQIAGNKIIYLENNTLIKYDTKFLTEVKLYLPDTTNIKNVNIQNNILYIFKDEFISIYQIE